MLCCRFANQLINQLWGHGPGGQPRKDLGTDLCQHGLIIILTRRDRNGHRWCTRLAGISDNARSLGQDHPQSLGDHMRFRGNDMLSGTDIDGVFPGGMGRTYRIGTDQLLHLATHLMLWAALTRQNHS